MSIQKEKKNSQIKMPFLKKESSKNNDDSTNTTNIDDESYYLNKFLTPDSLREKPPTKYIFMFAACNMLVGGFYSNNFHALLKVQIKQICQLSDTKFNLFSILSSASTIPFALLGGVLIDLIGIRRNLLLFSFLTLLGAIIITIGGYYNSFTIMLVGRILNNIGSEVLAAATNSIISKWYIGKNLALISSLNLTFGRFSSMLSGWIYAPLYVSSDSLFLPLFIGAIVCLYSLICAIVVCIIDRKIDNQLLLAGQMNGQTQEKPKLKWSDIKKLNYLYWLSVLIISLNYGIYYPFTQNILTLFVKKYKISSVLGGKILSIPPFIGLSSPFIGFMLSRFGKMVWVLIAATIIGTASLSMFEFLPECDGDCTPIIILAMVLLGLFFTTYTCVLWPSISILVDQSIVGTAYGVAYASKNIMSTFVPYEAGHLIDQDPSYDTEILFFYVLIFISLGLAITLLILDIKNGGKLNKPGQKKDIEEKEKKLRAGSSYVIDR